jgi:hypothetical protein
VTAARTCLDCAAEITGSCNRKRCPECSRKHKREIDRKAAETVRVKAKAPTRWELARARIKAKYGCPGMSANGGHTNVLRRKCTRL